MSKETGGPAFPITTIESSHRVGSGFQIDSKTSGGMTLRDYFAAKAMQGVWACGGNMDGFSETIADAAYKQADAMLKARGS